MKRVLINGYFLLNNMTGIERMGYETLLELDKIIEPGTALLLAPANGKIKAPLLNNIEIIETSDYTDTKSWWKLMIRMAESSGRVIVNMTTWYSPQKHSIITMPDVRYLDKDCRGEYFDSFRFRLRAGMDAFGGVRHADIIVTISEFSKSRIKKHFKVSDQKIHIIPCAWQHYEKIEEDTGIFEKLPQIEKGNYYFSVGTMARHKNHKWLKDAAVRNPRDTFVICGGIDRLIWKEGLTKNDSEKIVFTGRISDGEMKSLMKNAKAFIFPSLYEGFGIPPLEAMSVGTDCIVSDIPTHREIFGGSVHYIDPYSHAVDLDTLMKEELTETKEEILSKYSWERAAYQWLKLIEEL